MVWKMCPSTELVIQVLPVHVLKMNDEEVLIC